MRIREDKGSEQWRGEAGQRTAHCGCSTTEPQGRRSDSSGPTVVHTGVAAVSSVWVTIICRRETIVSLWGPGSQGTWQGMPALLACVRATSAGTVRPVLRVLGSLDHLSPACAGARFGHEKERRASDGRLPVIMSIPERACRLCSAEYIPVCPCDCSTLQVSEGRPVVLPAADLQTDGAVGKTFCRPGDIIRAGFAVAARTGHTFIQGDQLLLVHTPPACISRRGASGHCACTGRRAHAGFLPPHAREICRGSRLSRARG